MKRCESCRVTLQNDLQRCPLCGGELTEQGGACERDFPPRPEATEKKKWMKILTFASALAVTVCVLVDILTAPNVHWSAIVAMGMLYLWLSILFIKKSRRNFGLLALIQVFGISLLSFAIDSATGYSKWSTNYVIPFVIISAVGLMTLMLLLRPKRFRDYILYQLGIAALGVVVSVLSLLYQDTEAWTGIVGVAYSGLTILGIILFTSRKTKHELRKRFHF